MNGTVLSKTTCSTSFVLIPQILQRLGGLLMLGQLQPLAVMNVDFPRVSAMCTVVHTKCFLEETRKFLEFTRVTLRTIHKLTVCARLDVVYHCISSEWSTALGAHAVVKVVIPVEDVGKLGLSCFDLANSIGIIAATKLDSLYFLYRIAFIK